MSTINSDLSGKVALITGGGSGIGRGFAHQMARRGANVVVADINGDAAAQVAEEVGNLGAKSLSFPLDIVDRSAIETAVSETIQQFDHLDILFANAGALGPSAYSETTAQDWDLVVDVNIKGTVNTCSAVVPHMMARKQGRILTTASYNGLRAGAYVIPYRVSKAAILMYTRCLALVMAPYNVTVNAICPGVTLTPMQLSYAEKTAREQGISLEAYLSDRSSRIPMQQFTEIEDLNGLAEFLVSDSARLITGQAIGVDGGMIAAS